MRDLLTRHPDLDAVFVASDLMAAAALRVLQSDGRRVPDDVAVVGFDDSELGRTTNPPLTTIRQPTEELGRGMVELLLAQLAGDPLPREPLMLETQLIIRAVGLTALYTALYVDSHADLPQRGSAETDRRVLAR